MSKIKLIVEIDEETYNDIQSRDWKNGELVFSEEWKAIHNGIPLKDEVMIATLMSLVTDKDYKPKLEGENE